MKTNTPLFRPLIALGLAAIFNGHAIGAVIPETTEEGLVRVKSADTDVVYRLPAAKFDGYTKIALVDPQISFRKDWQHDANSSSSVNKLPNKVTAEDMKAMIDTGKQMLVEELVKALGNAGYTFTQEHGADVLAVRPTILDLDIYAPDPDHMAGAWAKTYANGVGQATLCIELFDGVTGQLLVRAFDHKSGADGSPWQVQRNQSRNIEDARAAFANWAKMLVKGLERAKTAKTP